jgi:hypothetical protein
MMKFANAIAGVTLVAAFCGANGWSQGTDATAKPKAVDGSSCIKNNTCVEQTFYLANAFPGQPNDMTEIYNALHYTLPQDVKVDPVTSRNAILVIGSPEQLALAQQIIHELDRPQKVYRLTYTITEMDGGKRLSAQHFSMDVEDGQHVTLKEGSRVPMATGSVGGAQTSFQYLDVGMNFDATLNSIEGGGVLKSKVEQSGVAAESVAIGDSHEPVIRQTALEGTSVLTLGKPLVLGSVDVPGSTRHLDVEVVMELVK